MCHTYVEPDSSVSEFSPEQHKILKCSKKKFQDFVDAKVWTQEYCDWPRGNLTWRQLRPHMGLICATDVYSLYPPLVLVAGSHELPCWLADYTLPASHGLVFGYTDTHTRFCLPNVFSEHRYSPRIRFAMMTFDVFWSQHLHVIRQNLFFLFNAHYHNSLWPQKCAHHLDVGPIHIFVFCR